MKKLLIGVTIAIGAVIILGVLIMSLFLDGLVKRGIETVGPMLTKVDIKLQSVSLSLLSGSGTIKGLVVGNPAGYKTPSAIQVGNASIALQPGSVFADKVVIKAVRVESPEITFETDLKGNNLSKIIANLQASTGGQDSRQANPAQPSKPASAGKKLEVDDFLIRGAKLHVSVTTLGNQSATVPLPDIHLADLGKGPDGITAAELTQQVLQAIEKEAVQAANGALSSLGKQAAGITKGMSNTATGTVDQVTKDLGGLFKKK
jgi:uncharacterized protein involved in outer membrane biogenesis